MLAMTRSFSLALFLVSALVPWRLSLLQQTDEITVQDVTETSVDGNDDGRRYTVSQRARRGLDDVPWIAYLIPFFGLAGLVFTYWKSSWVARQEVGTERMAKIAANITEGAMSFLKAEYTILIMFVLAVALLLGYGGTTGRRHLLAADRGFVCVGCALLGIRRICRDEGGDQGECSHHPCRPHWTRSRTRSRLRRRIGDGDGRGRPRACSA